MASARITIGRTLDIFTCAGLKHVAGGSINQSVFQMQKGPEMKHVEPIRGQSYETSGGPHEDILMIVDFSEKDWDYQKPIVAAEWMPLHSKRRATHH